MTYCCEDCGFLFARIGEVRECPYCEGPNFRHATQEEAERLREMIGKEAGMDKISSVATT